MVLGSVELQGQWNKQRVLVQGQHDSDRGYSSAACWDESKQINQDHSCMGLV